MSARAPKVQACDGCRTRKVRCNGRQPCPQCEHFNLHCTFSPKKERTYGRRGRLVAQLRNGGNDNPTKPGSASSFPPLRPRGSDEGREDPISTAPPHEQHIRNGKDHFTAESPITSQSTPSAGLVEDAPSPFAPHATYTAEYFSALIPDFESYTYPVNPIITSEQIRTCIGLMSIDATRAALVFKLI